MNCTKTLPPNFNTLSALDQKRIIDYLNSLSEIEDKAYIIAMDHLGTSFNILKSNGFIKWEKSKKI